MLDTHRNSVDSKAIDLNHVNTPMKPVQDSPLISIVTVCLNSAGTIHHAFDSVLRQQYQYIDYVVVDGDSSDETLDIVKQYEPKFQSRGLQFRWVSEPDEGIYDAMNKGIAMAQGDVIGMLNSDDFYEPDAFQTIADACVDHPEVGVFYGFLRLLRDGKEIQVYRYRYERYLLDLTLGIHSAAQHPTCFVRRDVYRQIGLFDPQFATAADYDFLIRAMQACVKFHPLNAVLCNYSSGGATHQVADVERYRQQYAIWFKNGLISESEYRKKSNQLRYVRYKELKRKLVKWVFRF